MKKTTLSLLISGLLFNQTARAESVDEAAMANQLETIEVSDQAFSQQMGTQKITAAQIAKLPSRNGNITELLRTNPNVTFASSSNNSNNGGDIRPDEVSFHGEKFYNNNFVIDGMSNNDNLNPAGGLYDSGNRNPYGLPEGGTQSIWLDTSLLESVEVFDSNVGAKYGNFTGGVVDAKLKDPDFNDNTGKVYYRTTRSAWARFHIDPKRENEFRNSTRLDQHSHYTKHIYGFNLSQKINDKLAVRLAYNRTESNIAFYHSTMRNVDALGNAIGGSIREPQRRENETFLLRGVYLPDNGDLVRFTAIYSPHTARLNRANIRNGQFETQGGGVQANVEWEKNVSFGKINSYLGYKKTGDRLDNDAQYMHSYRYVPGLFSWRNAVDGDLSPTGGFGRVYTEKTLYTAKQDLNFTQFDLVDTQHKFSAGWLVEYAIAKYQRKTPTANYSYRLDQNVRCNGASECFDGAEYAYVRNYYPTRHVKANDTNLALYVQDEITWKRLEMTLGARVEHSVFSGNTNLSPRFSASFDVFGDRRTRIFGGANRYYNGTLLAYKLRQGIGENERSSRSIENGVLQNWSDPVSGAANVPTHYLGNKVKTPFSDELNLGVAQKIADHEITFKWVNRKSRDGLSSTSRHVNDRIYRVLVNNGRGENNNFALTINSPHYQSDNVKFGWSFTARRSISKKVNNRDYDNFADDSSRAIYNGVLLDVGERPNSDFNSPWGLALGTDLELPKWHFT